MRSSRIISRCLCLQRVLGIAPSIWYKKPPSLTEDRLLKHTPPHAHSQLSHLTHITHAFTLTQSHVYTHTYSLTQTHSHTHMHTPSHLHTHTSMQSLSQSHTCTLTHMHAHTAHSHTPSPCPQFPNSHRLAAPPEHQCSPLRPALVLQPSPLNLTHALI